jgi:predicted ATPase
MGLHSGEAVVRGGRYRGLAVGRAARLGDLAHPGQILLSQTTAGLAADHLPGPAYLRDVGIAKLGGLASPEHLFQLCHPRLRLLDFPPVAPADAPPDNLPVSLTSFVGRDQEVTDVRKLIEAHRLVTLIGSGGVGKTRLALAVGHEVVDAHRDGAWFVDLAPLTDPALVPKAVAEAVGLKEEPRRGVVETLAAHLRSRDLLLVVDNCEHLVSACAGLVERLLATCPGVRMLATSREPLGVPGEVMWRVPTLRVPARDDSPDAVLECESVKLLLDRASAVRPGLSVEDRDLYALATICVRLDGIPLALELAAARTAILGLPEIADRLDDRFRLLTGGQRTGMPRHRTLRAAIDWSYGLLPPAERILLQRLSVFAGGFTLPAAEAVCSDGGVPHAAILDLLGGLAAKSLVVVEDRGAGARYRLLETIRQYARERLNDEQSQDAAPLARRHRDWYLAIAEAAEEEVFVGSGGKDALDQLERDQDNFRAALGWSLEHAPDEFALRLGHALYPLWEVRNQQLEGRRWLEALLDRSRSETGLASAMARRAGNLAWELGDGDRAIALLERALATARRSGDRRHLARALTSLGNVTGLRGDLRLAQSLLEQGHALAREVGDQLFIAESLLFQAWVALHQSAYDRARDLLQAHETVCAGSWWQQVRSLLLRGRVEEDTGNYAAARSRLEECRSLAVSEGARVAEGTAIAALGSVAAAEGRLAEARQAYEESLARSREPVQGFLVGPLGGLGELAAAEGRHDAARALLARELELARESGDLVDVVRTLHRLGSAAAARADREAARSAYSEALALCHAAGTPRLLADSLTGLGTLDAAEAGGEGGRAARLLAAAETIRDAIGAPLTPAARPVWERAVASAREILGDPGFDAAWAQGRALPLDDAVAFALGRDAE